VSTDPYLDRPADEYSLSHDEIHRGGLSEPSDFMDAPDDMWPDEMIWNLGDGVEATNAQIRSDPT